MVERAGFFNWPKAILLSALFTLQVQAQSADLTQSPGLKRFNPQNQLTDSSTLDIKNIKVGDNVLAKTLELQGLGGEVQYISGGSRSRKLEVVFRQPYQDSSLLQTMTLDFDKDKGFITTATLNYKIDSIYVDILPVYRRVVEQAIKKYGTPLTLSQVREIVGQPTEQVRLQTFIDRLQADKDILSDVKNFFEDKVVTRRTHFDSDEQGNALLITGFKQCYYWPRDNNSEFVTLCAFRPNSGNMKGQGIDLQLVDFKVLQSIANYNEDNDLSDISFE